MISMERFNSDEIMDLFERVIPELQAYRDLFAAARSGNPVEKRMLASNLNRLDLLLTDLLRAEKKVRQYGVGRPAGPGKKWGQARKGEIEAQERAYSAEAGGSADAEMAQAFQRACATAIAHTPLSDDERENIERVAYNEALFESGGYDQYGSLP